MLNSILSSDRLDKATAGNAPFTVVRQAVTATMDKGVWHAGLIKLCRFFDMVPMHHSSYIKHMLAVTDASKQVVTRVLDSTATTVRNAYRQVNPSIPEEDVIDMTVSFDGSWMIRGHKSSYGIGCVTDTVTGLAVDLAIFSLYCQRCSYAETIWRQGHRGI